MALPPPTSSPHPDDELNLLDTVTIGNWNCQVHALGSYIPPPIPWSEEQLFTPFSLGSTHILHPLMSPSWGPLMFQPDTLATTTTVIDAMAFLDSGKKGMVDAGIINDNDNPLKHR